MAQSKQTVTKNTQAHSLKKAKAHSPKKMRAWAIASLVMLSPSAVTLLRPQPAISSSLQPATPVTQTIAQAPINTQERVLTVSGAGIRSIETTRTLVSLGVRVEATTATAAQQQAAQKQTAVIEYLRSQNVEELETTGISLQPRYDYRNDRQVLRGYEATNTVSFQATTETAGAIMDGAVKAGATQINRVSFVAEDTTLENARQQALEAAVADAQSQADAVLGALGLSREEVIGITIGSVSAPPPSPALARADFAESAVSTPVVGQSQTIRAAVTLNIRY